MNIRISSLSLLILVRQYQDVKGEGVVVVPRDDCTWYGGDYGEKTFCFSNQVPVGSCGSGRDADCYNNDASRYQYDMIYCCAIDDYNYQINDENCYKVGGNYGSSLSCVGYSGGSGIRDYIVEGVCGSGKNDDCDGFTHAIYCCTGTLDSGQEHLYSTGDCYWQYGNFGSTLYCSATTEAIFGRCGSGGDPDCDEGSTYHGIQCCSMISLRPT